MEIFRCRDPQQLDLEFVARPLEHVIGEIIDRQGFARLEIKALERADIHLLENDVARLELQHLHQV